MAAKTTSCFSSLKEALTPLLAYSVYGFLQIAVKIVYISPLTVAMSRHLAEMEHTDPSSAEYAALLGEVRQEAGELLLISIAVALVALTISFAKQIVVACFAASTKDRYSPTELLREVVKYLKGPFIAIAVVAMLQAAFAAILHTYVHTLIRSWLSVQGFLAGVAYLAYLLSGHAVQVGVAASVVDGACRGVRGIFHAWRVIFQVRTTLDSVLVLVTLLLPTVLIPLYAVALLYTKLGMGFGLSLLSAYDLLNGVLDMSYLEAASAYCYQANQNKQIVVASSDGDGYAAIPPGEANVDGAAQVNS